MASTNPSTNFVHVNSNYLNETVARSRKCHFKHVAAIDLYAKNEHYDHFGEFRFRQRRFKCRTFGNFAVFLLFVKSDAKEIDFAKCRRSDYQYHSSIESIFGQFSNTSSLQIVAHFRFPDEAFV